MRSTPIILVALFVALPLAASVPEIPDPDDGGINPRQLIGFRTCLVREVGENRRIVLLDEGDGMEHVLTLSPKLRIRAQSKKDFGRRKLRFEDLEPGHRVQVNFRKSDGGIVGIDVLRQTER